MAPELSGNWRVTIMAARGLKAGGPAPTTIDFTMDSRTVSVPILPNGGSKKAADKTEDKPADGELPLNVARTFYLYGTHDGSKGEGDLQVEVKAGESLLGSVTIPHDKKEAEDEWVSLKGPNGEEAGQVHVKSQWISKIYVNPTGTNHILTLAYALLFGLWLASYFIPIPVPVNLISSTVSIVYIGCHRSLYLRDRGTVPPEEQEAISKEDAYKFPIVGSGVLFGLYILFKIFDKDMVNLLLSFYFFLIGTYVLANTLAPFIALVLRSESFYGPQFTLPWLGHVDLRVTPAEAVSFVVGAALSGYYFKTKHWLLNNVFGIAFSIQGIERITLGSYKVGAILLVGLFFYDIWWVFGTEVMVTVAKSFEAPIKLLFPRSLPAAKANFSMLGLGDIVIPGIFIALLLRYDAERSSISPKSGPYAAFSKPYFNTCLVAYTLGLGTTIFVMYKFNAAQPALLYLVPACLIASLGTALLLKDFTGLFAYSEEEDSQPEVPTEKKND